MATITAALVKELRDKTSAGMMDCKKALNETNGDLEAAADWLRTKGIAKADKKAGRVAADGLIGFATSLDQKTGALVEVNAETDFVARNEEFQATVREIANLGVEAKGDIEALRGMETSGGVTVSDHMTALIAKIGENMALRRTASASVDQGVVAGYIHNAAGEGLGKIGVLIALESSADDAVLIDLGRKIAMHVAATSPLALSVDDLDPAIVERERKALVDEAKESGKPEAIIDKMVEGRIRKFYQESVLLQQAFVMDPDNTVEAYIAKEAKELGVEIKLSAYERMALGEGIEKVEEDFAAEVAAMSNN